MSVTIEAKADFHLKAGKSSWERGVLTLAAFSAIVNIGGLSAMQNILATNDVRPIAAKLVGVPYFNTVLGGPQVGQPLWFVTSWNIVTVAMGLLCAVFATSQLPKYKGWLIGLFTVGVMLNIFCGDAWLSAIDVSFSGPLEMDGAKTTVAGYILSGAFQAILILLLGWE